jgi:folate-dependent tRNA-U54 methylase TrmFO/GidA
MKANMGLFPEISKRIPKKTDRYAAYAARARDDLEGYLRAVGFTTVEDM